jgi:hypothetical protein
MKEKNDIGFLTLITFNTNYTIEWNRVPLKECKNIDDTIYHPNGGTALRDALGTAITVTKAWFTKLPEAERPGTVSFFVCTDGAENSSREYSAQQVK